VRCSAGSSCSAAHIHAQVGDQRSPGSLASDPFSACAYRRFRAAGCRLCRPGSCAQISRFCDGSVPVSRARGSTGGRPGHLSCSPAWAGRRSERQIWSTNATRRPPTAAHGAVLTWRAAAHDDHVMVIAAHALRSARRPMPGLLVHHVPRVPAWPVRIGMPDLLLSGLRCREKGGLGHPSPPCRCSRPAAGLASCSPRSVLARSPQKTFRPLTRSSAARSRPLMVRPRRVTTSSTWVPPPG